MMDTTTVQRRLEGLAAPLAHNNGLHLGMRTNNQAIELEYGQMIYGAILDKRPEYVVEFGTGSGYSTTWILLGLEKNQFGAVWSFDVSQPQPPVWEQVGCEIARLIWVNGLFAENLNELPPRIDLFFHDGAHNFNSVKTDIELIQGRIPKGGIVLVHDVNYARPMGDQLAEWFDSMPDDWKYQEMSSGCGIGIAERISDNLGGPNGRSTSQRIL